MPPQPQDLNAVIKLFTDIGLKIIPFLGAVALFVFLLSVGKFIRASGNEKELKDSKKLLIWGVIGIFVLTTIWGIMVFIRGEFGFNSTFGIPQINI
ncbi:MAG: hypothetical protein AAB392_03240 [Patescibacteria group bacterium]